MKTSIVDRPITYGTEISSYLEDKDQGPELQCLLRVNEDLSIDILKMIYWMLNLPVSMQYL